MDARIDYLASPLALKIVKHINSAGAALHDSALPAATQELVWPIWWRRRSRRPLPPMSPKNPRRKTHGTFQQEAKEEGGPIPQIPGRDSWGRELRAARASASSGSHHAQPAGHGARGGAPQDRRGFETLAARISALLPLELYHRAGGASLRRRKRRRRPRGTRQADWQAGSRGRASNSARHEGRPGAARRTRSRCRAATSTCSRGWWRNPKAPTSSRASSRTRSAMWRTATALARSCSPPAFRFWARTGSYGIGHLGRHLEADARGRPRTIRAGWTRGRPCPRRWPGRSRRGRWPG